MLLVSASVSVSQYFMELKNHLQYRSIACMLSYVGVAKLKLYTLGISAGFSKRVYISFLSHKLIDWCSKELF